jgi:DNA-binding IclR family transcriptional regulator
LDLKKNKDIKNPIENHTAIDKALSILRLFIPHNQELSSTVISQSLDYHKATVSRTIGILLRQGFLEQDAQTRKYRLGTTVMSLGIAISNSLKSDLVSIAKPYLDELRDEVGESVGFELLVGNKVVLAYNAEGPNRVRLAATIGESMPTHIAAGAKAILAFLPPEGVDKLLEKELQRFTPNTITDHGLLKKRLKKIRKDGISIDIGEHDEDIIGVAAPILDAEGLPVASVVVAGPSNRISSDKNSNLSLLIRSTALRISKRIYYPNQDITD